MNNKSCLKLIMWYSKATSVPSVNDSKATPVPSVSDNWKHIARGITKMMDETLFLSVDHIACQTSLDIATQWVKQRSELSLDLVSL
jgi:hypothetical protein